jgi:hypothetical protein
MIGKNHFIREKIIFTRGQPGRFIAQHFSFSDGTFGLIGISLK